MAKKYDVHYFIKKFEAIPKECIIPHRLHNEYNNIVQGCTNGWCGVTDSGTMYVGTEKSTALAKLLNLLPVLTSRTTHLEFPKEDTTEITFSARACFINDGHTKEYRQETPKERILAALYDIKKMQQPKYEDVTKELAILPEEKKEQEIFNGTHIAALS